MAVPKRKSSKARKNKRRSNVWKLEAPAMCRCTQCGSFKLPHRVCPRLRLLQGRRGHQGRGITEKLGKSPEGISFRGRFFAGCVPNIA